jgi:amino acid permease
MMTGINLAGSVIGMGNLEFPYFMKTWGFYPTMIFFVAVFYLMYTSCSMLWSSREMSGENDLCKVSLRCFGKWGIIAHISILLYNIGICVAFVIIYFATLEQLFTKGFGLSEDSLLMNATLQTAVFILMNLNFIFALTVKGLKFASIGVFVCHILFIVVSFQHFFILTPP